MGDAVTARGHFPPGMSVRRGAAWCALLAVSVAAGILLGLGARALTQPGAPPDHFGSCPSGQHWSRTQAGLPECVR